MISGKSKYFSKLIDIKINATFVKYKRKRINYNMRKSVNDFVDEDDFLH